jgi:hypothetical protein
MSRESGAFAEAACFHAPKAGYFLSLPRTFLFVKSKEGNHPSLLQDADYSSVALTLAFPVCYAINSNTTCVNLSLHSRREAPHRVKTKCNR